MKPPVAGLMIGAFVGGLAAVPLSLVGYLSESLGLAIIAVIGALMVPVSGLVAVFTIAGYRLVWLFAEDRATSERTTVVVGLTAAAIFGSLIFAACALVFDSFLASYFAVPIIGATVGSVAGALVSIAIASRVARTTKPVVVPLQLD